MKIEQPLICIHGYGLRGLFWETFSQIAKDSFTEIHTPNLSMTSIEEAINEIIELSQTISTRSGKPVILTGHSLGGVLIALAARNMEPSLVSHCIIMASPWGERKQEMPRLTRFFLWKGLIPQFIIRKRFFGKGVSRTIQKRLFASAVKEKPEFQHAINQKRWFHTDSFSHKPKPNMLFLASMADRIVPAAETQAFALALHAKCHTFTQQDGIGHDDFGVSPRAITMILQQFRLFISE